MSMWKTLAAALGGVVAVGVGVRLGRASARSADPMSAELAELERRVRLLEPLRAEEAQRTETIVKAIAQLAEHSGEMEKRIRTLESPAGVEAALERQIGTRFGQVDAILQRHSQALSELNQRTAAGERAWQELVARMETLCHTLQNSLGELEEVSEEQAAAVSGSGVVILRRRAR